MRRILVTLASSLFLCAPALAAGETGCSIALARTARDGIGTYRAECHWPVPARLVADVVGDRTRLAKASSSLAESTKLPDGRVVNVISPGWPIDDRQSTLAIERAALPDGGLLLSYTLAAVQAPVGKGRVQTRRDDGRWEIRSDGRGGCSVRYETTFDAGGRLPLSLVQRAMPERITKSLREVRAAAEQAARIEPQRAGSS